MRTIQLPIRISVTILTLAVLLSQFAFVTPSTCSANTCAVKKCPCGCCEQADSTNHSCCQKPEQSQTVVEGEDSQTFQRPKNCHCQEQQQPPALPIERSLPLRVMSEPGSVCLIDTPILHLHLAHPQSLGNEDVGTPLPFYPSLSILFCTWLI